MATSDYLYTTSLIQLRLFYGSVWKKIQHSCQATNQGEVSVQKKVSYLSPDQFQNVATKGFCRILNKAKVTHSHRRVQLMKCGGLSLLAEPACFFWPSSVCSTWEREPGLSTVRAGNILMLHQPTPLKLSLWIRLSKPYISSLLGSVGEDADIAVLLWRRIMTICFCGSYMRQESGRTGPVLFLFTYVFFSELCESKCAMTKKGFREFCIKLSYCSFLSWMML